MQKWVDDASPVHPNLIATKRLSCLPLRQRIRYGCGALLH
jgi:hypothetical protein